jgi:hypothetical protein
VSVRSRTRERDTAGRRQRGKEGCMFECTCLQICVCVTGTREHITKASDKEAASIPMVLLRPATKVVLELAVCGTGGE